MLELNLARKDLQKMSITELLSDCYERQVHINGCMVVNSRDEEIC